MESGKPYFNENALSLGIDIGTTTVSAVLAGSNGFTESLTVPNDTALKTEQTEFREQDAKKIIQKVIDIAEHFTGKYPEIGSIGLTCQMHGIVYIDKAGRAVSNLMTWQDGRGNIPDSQGITPCRKICVLTGIPENSVHSGYGLVTHFYNINHGLVPESAVTFATIGDYAGMKLTGKISPVVHSSNAHSFGFFSAKDNSFDTEALSKLGISAEFLPEVTVENKITGYFRNIPVSVAVGDNQASFFGSVMNDEHSVLVNIGTGSQVSAITDNPECGKDNEIRPYFNGRYLVSGSALCGGRAYAALEKFFRSYIEAAGGPSDPQYGTMNILAEKALNNNAYLNVDTAFCGTRSDPSLRGSIHGISEENLLPENLIAGVLYGMANELYCHYVHFNTAEISRIVASGNGVRKNPALVRIISSVFGKDITITEQTEEAAYGAAMLAAYAAGTIS